VTLVTAVYKAARRLAMSFNAFGAKIKVIGVGGGGGNAVNTMIRSGLEGVDFIVANTDAQALKASLAPHKIQLGKDLTKGLGAGADPDIGRDAAVEDRMELQDFLSDADMVFITAGMGGGTGTGAAAVVAQIARELGALTVAVVTKPFAFEGKRRRKHAEQGVARLRECVDTLITIPNQRLLQVATPDLSMLDAFKLADNVLVNAVRGISDIINTPGLINVDFADVKTVMSSMGHALMGIGYGAGAERALAAAKQAISSPLLEDVDIEGATGILINITAGTNVSIMEVNNACMVIQEAAHEDANIIFGAVIDETLGDEIRITVIATGFPVEEGLPVDDSLHASSRSLGPASGSRSQLQQGSVVPQRLVSPPRLTSQPLVSSRPAITVPTSPQRNVHQPVTKSFEGDAPTQQPQTVVNRQHAPVAPQSYSQQIADQVARAPITTFAAEEEAPKPIDAALEASALAQWTMEELTAVSPVEGADLSGLDIERSDAPGTPVFTETPAQTQFHKTVAEMVFIEEPAAQDLFASGIEMDEVASIWGSPSDLERAGAIVAQDPQAWEFDAPNPELVSNEIDRRIDEALALAGKMTQLNSEAAQPNAAQDRQGLDLDDLDLPAFLRYGSDARQGG